MNRAAFSGFNANVPEEDPKCPAGEGKEAAVSLVGMVVAYPVSPVRGAG